MFFPTNILWRSWKPLLLRNRHIVVLIARQQKDTWVDPNPWLGATLVVRPHYHAWPPTTSYLQIIFCSVRIFEKVFIRTNIQEGCLLLYCCIIAYFAPVLPLCHETVDCLNVTKQSRCQGRKDHGAGSMVLKLQTVKARHDWHRVAVTLGLDDHRGWRVALRPAAADGTITCSSKLDGRPRGGKQSHAAKVVFLPGTDRHPDNN